MLRQPTRGKFFCEIITLKVDDTVHRIPRFYLEESSPFFKDMFSLPQGPEAEGQTEANPIMLSGCTNTEFESLLEVIINFGRVPLKLSKDEWISALKLATMWDMSEIRERVIQELESMKLAAAEKIGLGKKFGVADWLVDGCVDILQGSENLDLDNLAGYIGWEATARIAYEFKRAYPPWKVTIQPTKFRCRICEGFIFRSAEDAKLPNHSWMPRRCAACYHEIPRDGSVRIHLPDVVPQSQYITSLSMVKKALADDLKFM